MEIRSLRKSFKCDGLNCDQLGVIRYSSVGGTVISRGTWYSFATQGGGVSLDFCSKKCLCEKVSNEGMTPQTVITIKTSWVENQEIENVPT